MFDITSCKMNLISDLISNQSIIDLIDSQSSNYIKEDAKSLIYENIFPYIRVPEAHSKADCYILISCDNTNINEANPTYADYLITIWCLSHQDRMRMNGTHGTRIDLLSEEIIKLFDGNQKYGYSNLDLISNKEVILNEQYQYRELQFAFSNLRYSVCSKKR